MKIINTVATILCLLLSINSISQSNENDSIPNIGAIGDVKFSILNPEQFRKQNGNGWVLLDGGIDLSSIGLKTNETALSVLIRNDSIPDARGLFLRSLNYHRNDGKGDPIERKVASYQLDTMKSHSHRIDYPFERTPYNKDIMPDGVWETHPNMTNAGVQTTTGYKTNTKKSVGGIETRPKNIAFFLYIKVN